MERSQTVNKWGVLLATVIGGFTIILNNSLMNVALPYFMKEYQLTATEAQWIVTVFALGMVITMPLSGYLQREIGIKTVYLVGIIFFLFASFFASWSWNFYIIIVFRLLQGLGGGLVMPLSMMLIFQFFPKNERGYALGIWGISAMVAPAVGPSISGVILNYSGWKMLFLLNVPTALLTALATLFFLKTELKREHVPFDLKGFLLITVSLTTLLLGIEQVQSPWNGWIVYFLFGIGLITFIIFVWHELRVPTPLLNLRILANKVFSASLFLVFCSTGAMMSMLLLIPLLIQDVLGETPLMAGLILFPQAVATGIAMVVGGRLLDFKGPFVVLIGGTSLLTVVMFLLAGMIGEIPATLLVVFLFLQGLGNGMINTPASTAGLNALAEEDVQFGSIFNNIIRQLIKVSVVILLSMFYDYRRGMYMIEMSAQEAGILAVKQSFMLIGLLVALSIPLILFLRKDFSKK